MTEKTLTSTEFRQGYATLTEPTVVTALGRVIGVWYPTGSVAEINLVRPIESQVHSESLTSTAVPGQETHTVQNPAPKHSFGKSRPAPK